MDAQNLGAAPQFKISTKNINAFFLSMLSPLILIHKYFFNASKGFKDEIIIIIIKRMLLCFGREKKSEKRIYRKRRGKNGRD
jgi:hypothetical protein